MTNLKEKEIWFATGSQHLYGEEILNRVSLHSKVIAKSLMDHQSIPVKIVFKALLTLPHEVTRFCTEANADSQCIGVIVWMHTFSPAKMWIHGLKVLYKPILHFHTQYNAEIPWSTIDMDFMNENQSAHGDREFGFLTSRMKKKRKIVVGHWRDKVAIGKIAIWARVVAGWNALQTTRVARLGDNMREVAVTEGDKVEAQMRFGFSVNGYGLADLEGFVSQVSKKAIQELLEVYDDLYEIDSATKKSQSLRDAAQIELGLRAFLAEGGFQAFTDTFENLGGLKQLPGIAVQRLMAEGYGFGAEGDWKTAALLRAVKVMGTGLPGGTSFMEDYTYDFGKGWSRVLGSHMLEICPSIASGMIRCEVHPLGIGGKADPVRLVFDGSPGPAINVSLIDLGNRFRLIVNEVDAVEPEHPLPKLPVARVLWDPRPDLATAAETWMLAGGAHHTVYSQSVDVRYIEDFAEIAGVELVVIDKNTSTRDFKDRLKWNEVYYHLFSEV